MLLGRDLDRRAGKRVLLEHKEDDEISERDEDVSHEHPQRGTSDYE